jgi:Lrp/AsnC family leucine-responsive transcriptional regulator
VKINQIEGDDKLLDDVGWAILELLQADARISFSALGRRVGLSAPAVTERVRKLEDAGIITGYHAAVDASRIGRPIAAIIRLGNPGDRSELVVERVKDMPEVLECNRITGHEAFVFKVAVATVEHLEQVIGQLEPYGITTTSIILSTPVTRRILLRPEE